MTISEAEFTVNGRTALIKGPAAVPCRAGNAHGIYNPTDRPVQWMNVNVGFTKIYDAFDINDPRVGVNLDPIPQFISARVDRSLARAVENMNGGKGSVLYRRAFEPSVFLTTWSYVDHLIIPGGATVGPDGPSDVSETCYAMAGDGTVTLGGETVAFKAGDSLAVEAGQAKSFAGGSEPLQILVIGVARDMASKEALMARPRPRSGK